MKALDFWFDPVSPYAYLAFERLPEALAGLSYSGRLPADAVRGLLEHWGQKGRPRSSPSAPGPSARCSGWRGPWLAHGMALPSTRRRNIRSTRSRSRGSPGHRARRRHAEPHALRDDPAPRLAGRRGRCQRPGASAALREQLAPRLDPASDGVKQLLRDASEAALGKGMFGVPTIEVDGRLFWGLDACDAGRVPARRTLVRRSGLAARRRAAARSRSLDPRPAGRGLHPTRRRFGARRVLRCQRLALSKGASGTRAEDAAGLG